MEPLQIIAGFFVGICIGLTGVGGGALMTPILVLGFGLPPAIAVGTDLIYAACTKASGVFFHQLKRSIHWNIVGRLALGSIPASLVTLFWIQFENQQQVEQLISFTLGLALVLTSLVLLLKDRLQRSLFALSGFEAWLEKHRSLTLTLLGVCLGILVTLSSIGAGAITAAALFLLYPRMHTVAVVGTDLAHAVPLAAIAGLGHWQFGHVELPLIGALLIGSIPGTALGSQLAHHIPETVMRKGLAGILFITGLKFAF